MAYKAISPRKKEEMLEIDRLVLQFQGGDHDAGEELLYMFGGHPKEDVNFYIGKFYHMLRDTERFSFKDKDSRKFISCFIEDVNVRNTMKRARQTTAVRLVALNKLHKIVEQCKPITDEDLKQELRTMFIEQVKRYKNMSKNINFPGYLFNSYRYRIAVMITRQMKKYDPYQHMYNEKKLVSLQEDRYVDRGSEIQIQDKMFINEPMLIDDDELGNSWVRGITCGPEFRDLTPLQRFIIKLYYEDEMTDKAIGKKLGMHINTIHNNRKRSIKIIEEAKQRLFKEGHKDDY